MKCVGDVFFPDCFPHGVRHHQDFVDNNLQTTLRRLWQFVWFWVAVACSLDSLVFGSPLLTLGVVVIECHY